MKSSARSLRAHSRRNKFFAPAPIKTRAKLSLESLETRAVFNADFGIQNQIDVVFAPDTPAATILAYEDLQNRDGLDAFSFGDTDRWSRTATNTTSLTQGDPTIIRWSVVPDGTAISGYNGEPAAPSNLRSFLSGIYGSNASSSRAQDQPWFDEVKAVFDRWNAISGVTYVYEPADDGAALSSSYGGSLNVRGDVRISGHYIDGPYNILAYNFYPTVGDMVIDTGDTFFNTTTNNSIRLRNTMAHEAGHGLGLDHVTPVSGTKLMEPSISLGFDGPQADDILAVNRGYGDRLEKSGGNTAATAYSLGTGTTFSVDTISIDDDSDIDWFQFTVGAGSSLSVTATPTGSTYSSNDVAFNSLAQSNLTLNVYSNSGTTLLTSINAGAAGVAETLSNFSLPGSGTYYVRVTGNANAAQMYRLTGTISNVVVPNAPEIAVLDGATNIVDGSASVSLTTVNVGSASSKTFTIQNLGNANLTLGSPALPTGFILTQAPALTTVAPGASTTFVVSLDSSIAGTFSGALSFANNDADENPFNFTLAGTVTTPTPTAPEITMLDGSTNIADGTGSVNFGSVNTGATSTKTFTVRNDGTANLTLGSTVTLPAGFSLTQGPALTTLTPGQSTTFTIALNGTTAGTFSGAVSFTTNDANENPFNFTISGSVTNPTPTAPEIGVFNGVADIVDGTGSLDFGTVAFGGTSTKTVTIRNLGNGNLQLGSVTVPTGFKLTQAPGVSTLAPGVSTTFHLALDSSVSGTFSGEVVFANNDADENPYNFTVNGTVNAAPVTAAEISILDGSIELVDGASTLNFGSAAVGGTLSKTLTIRNTGDANLVLSQIVLPTAYSLTAGPGSTNLAPGASTTITLSLNTATAGTFSGAVSLANNDADEGQFNFTVTGTVTSAPATPTTLFSDNFNRINNSSLGTSWQERSGNFSINNQTLVNSTSGTSVALVNNLTAADVVLTADVNLATTANERDAGIVARHNGASAGSEYYGALAYRGGKYYSEIWEATNGNWNRLSAVQVASNGTASLKFEVIGSSLKLYVNGVLKNSVIDTSLTSGRFGVSTAGTGARVDNFVASSGVAPATAPVSAPFSNSAALHSAAAAASAQHAQWLALVDQLMAKWSRRNND